MKVLASCVRGALVPEDGKILQSFDFAGIESRVNAWLFNESWKLQAFREYDAGTGPDLYKMAYARAFRVPTESVDKDQRLIGKVMELALGYQGGSGAFVTMASTYAVDLDDLASRVWQALPPDVIESAEWMWQKTGGSELSHDVFIACDGIKQLWRKLHPKTVQGWSDLDEAATMAVRFPGKVFKLTGGKLAFKVEGDWLYLRLPSGRKLAYFKPEWDGESVTHLGIDTYTRRWMRTQNYGGKWCERACSGVARCLLVDAMFRLDDAGYDLIGTVHDETIAEVSPDFGSLDEARELMCRLPDWAAGLPVAAEGWRAKRYRK